MIDVTFDVSPAGIFGMDKLASFLNRLKATGAIADWHPRRAITESNASRYVVMFDSERDGAHATAQWNQPA